VIWKKQHANSGISTCGCLHLFSQILRILPVAKSPRATIAPYSRSAALRGLRAFGAVQVMVLDRQRKLVEKGEAIKGRGDWWEYVPTATGKMIVKAHDLAGNVVRQIGEW